MPATTATKVTQLPGTEPTLVFEVPFKTLMRMKRALAPFVSSDEGRPMLTCVAVTVVDGYLRFEATDSYMLTRIDTDIEGPTHFDGTRFIPWDWFERTMRAIRYRAATIEVKLAGEGIAVRAGEDNFATRIHIGTQPWPSFNGLITDKPVGVSAAGFNPEKLAQLASAIHRDGVGTVELQQMDPLKPTQIRLVGDRHSWPGHALLMPVRLTS